MEYENMTVAQLKELLREANLPVSGNKSALIERLSQNETIVESPIEISVEEDEEDYFEETFDEEGDFFDEDEWDQIHTARQKPVLDEETKANLLPLKSL
jgi:hypothetical protein